MSKTTRSRDATAADYIPMASGERSTPSGLTVDTEHEYYYQSSRPNRPSWLFWVGPWLMHGLLIVVYMTILLPRSCKTADAATSSQTSKSEIYNGAVPLAPKLVDFKDTTGYGGRPNPETDANYEKLIDVGIVSISAEEHQTLLRSSAKDQRAPGRFVVALDVFHQLHCVKSLREQVWRPASLEEHYEGENSWGRHLDHCIDYLRQSFMCQPDLTPTVYHWNVEYRGYEIADSLPHQCVDFDLVYEWALSRNTSGDTLENLGPLPELDA